MRCRKFLFTKFFLVTVHGWIMSINNILKGKLKIGEHVTDPMKKLAQQRYIKYLKFRKK